MTIDYHGPLVRITLDQDEYTMNDVDIQLADGYSYERIFISYSENVSRLSPELGFKRGDRLTFPAVNSKSPSAVQLHLDDTSKRSILVFTIEKFGQIPDTHYFDKAFEPILVTGDDGNEYNVIPSDQFK